MGGYLVERRRAPRVVPGSPAWLSAPTIWPVQLADVSLGGVSFSSPFPLEVEKRPSLRATLGCEAFNAQLRIRWSRPKPAAFNQRPYCEMGAAFVSLDECSRRALEVFLKLPPASESQHANQGR